MSVTDLLEKDPGLTPLNVRHSSSEAGNCHAVQVTEKALAGQSAALSLVSDNTAAGALRVQAAGSYVQFFNASNALKFEVTNSGGISAATLSSTGNSTVGGTLGVTGAVTFGSTLAVTGASTLTGNVGVTGTLTVTSTTTLTGAVTLTGGVAGSATVNGGDLTIQGTGKAYRFRRGGGGLDLEATGADLVLSNWSGTAFDGTQRSYLRFSADAQNIQVAGKVEFVDALYGATRHVLDGAANTIGFFGTAAAAKQTVSGSRAGNAALASLITALATYGIVTDGSSA